MRDALSLMDQAMGNEMIMTADELNRLTGSVPYEFWPDFFRSIASNDLPAVFAAIDGFSFENQGYANLYAALKDVQAEYTMVQEPNIPGYYDKVYALYGALREKQGQWKTQCAAGEDPAVFLNETLQLFQSVG